MEFRDLKADEIEIRQGIVKATGVMLLLYKDARVDQKILDETVGPENWMRDHKELKGNIYCGIGIWDENKRNFVMKWDAGKETYTEAEKGEASDSFKRAGTNWGIGRELYTQPYIWLNKTVCNITKNDNTGKYECNDYFKVTELEVKNKVITKLKIANVTTGVVAFIYPKQEIKDKLPEDTLLDDKKAKVLYTALVKKLGSEEKAIDYIYRNYGVDNTSKLRKSQYAEICKEMKKV